MKKERTLKISRVIFAIAALCVVRAWADATVYVRSSGFSPASASINVGESVFFVVADDNAPYCIQSTTGAWTPWYLWEFGDGFGIQFNQKGDYAYRDIFYGNQGIIHVGTSVTNLAPTVTITSPADGAVFTAPASFPFSAMVADPDGGVTAVEFYVGATLVDLIYSGDYSTQVTNLAAGSYTLSITAWDTLGATTTKSVGITVEPPGSPRILLSPPVLAGGQFRFEAGGLTVGKRAVLQGAPGVGAAANWTSLQTNNITGATMTFNQPFQAGSRFFRVIQLP